MMMRYFVLLTLLCLACGGGGTDSATDTTTNPSQAPAGAPTAVFRAVTIRGYTGQVMEPFLSRDGRYLFYNNPNSDPNPDLHLAERVDDVTFDYRGPLAAANTPGALEAVATMTSGGRFFFISTRDYATTLNTVFAGDFSNGILSNVQPQLSLATGQQGVIFFDVGVSPNGSDLIIARGLFSGNNVPDQANLVLAQPNGGNYRVVPTNIFDAVNTGAREYAPSLSPDLRTLLVTRLDQGSLSPQIFIARRPDANSPFAAAQLVVGLQAFVEAGTFNPDGSLFYYHARVNGRMELFVANVP